MRTPLPYRELWAAFWALLTDRVSICLLIIFVAIALVFIAICCIAALQEWQEGRNPRD